MFGGKKNYVVKLKIADLDLVLKYYPTNHLKLLHVCFGNQSCHILPVYTVDSCIIFLRVIDPAFDFLLSSFAV